MTGRRERDRQSHQISAGASETDTVNPLLSPPGELIYFKHVWGGGGGGGFIERGCLSNLAKMMVSIPHKELERKVEKSRDMKLVVMQPAINNRIELPAHE